MIFITLWFERIDQISSSFGLNFSFHIPKLKRLTKSRKRQPSETHRDLIWFYLSGTWYGKLSSVLARARGPRTERVVLGVLLRTLQHLPLASSKPVNTRSDLYDQNYQLSWFGPFEHFWSEVYRIYRVFSDLVNRNRWLIFGSLNHFIKFLKCQIGTLEKNWGNDDG